MCVGGEVVSSQAPGETLVLVEAARELITPRAHLGPQHPNLACVILSLKTQPLRVREGQAVISPVL